MTFYSEMASTSSRLLTDYGQTVTISRTAGKNIDPVTGVVTPGTTTTYSVYGVTTEYKAGEIDGVLIHHGDKKLIIDTTVDPLLTDMVSIGGVTHAVISIESKNPAGTALVHILQIRK